jgi:hypothetical protein
MVASSDAQDTLFLSTYLSLFLFLFLSLFETARTARIFTSRAMRACNQVLGELRATRDSPGSSRTFRSRRLLASHGLDDGAAEAQAQPSGHALTDRSGEAVRVFKVKQLIKLVLHGKGSGARATLERCFRLADKDGSGYVLMVSAMRQ